MAVPNLPDFPLPKSISDEGVRLIKSFEGYHKKLANGDCCAYQTPLGNGKFDIPTIGYGCTVGVHMGMVWTQEQAEAALRHEIAKHEAAVNQLVKVNINQNEFDACVSFSYNCGTGIGAKKGGFANSSILSRLNKGDRRGAANAFSAYVYSQGVKLPGLIDRRRREQALFLKPVVAPDEPYMPQTVDPPPNIAPKVATAGKATAVGGGIYYYIHQFLASIGMGDPSVPDGWEDQAYGLLSKAQDHASVLKSLASSGLLTYAAIAIAIYFVIGHYLPSKVNS